MGVIDLENQLIVYTPKRNIKKIILRLFLGIFVSLIIFILAALSSAAIFIRFKWNQTKGTNSYAYVVTSDDNLSKS